MNYEIVNLEEKIITGISTRTNNGDKEMCSKIGALWGKFFGEGIYESIENKVNDKCIGLYTNYEGDFNNDYDVVICTEVSKENPNFENRIIPAGKYAKFVLKGNRNIIVGEFWKQLWGMHLPRKYSGDFEEYQPGDSIENSEVHVYISLL